MSEEKSKITNIDIWPDWIALSMAFAIVVAIFFFTGLEISFEKYDRIGLYMEFTKIE